MEFNEAYWSLMESLESMEPFRTFDLGYKKYNLNSDIVDTVEFWRLQTAYTDCRNTAFRAFKFHFSVVFQDEAVLC